MFVAQGGKCAICSRPPKRIRLAVDHDHREEPNRKLAHPAVSDEDFEKYAHQARRKSVRALLCMICNRKVIGVIERYKIPPVAIAEYFRRPRPFA
jgi:hypothetical protein